MKVDDRVQRCIEHDIMVAWSGALAEGISTGAVFPWDSPALAGSDLDDVVTLALRVCGSGGQAGPYIELVRAHAFEHLRHPRHWRAVEALATALLQRGKLSWLEARDIMWAAASAQPPRSGRPGSRLRKISAIEGSDEPARVDAVVCNAAEETEDEDVGSVVVLSPEEDEQFVLIA